jgi:hypothetical protein
MPGHSYKSGYTNLQVMIRDVVTDLKSMGFQLLTAYTDVARGVNTAPNHDAATSVYVLAPTKTVDPLAVEEGDTLDINYSRRQPWRIVIQVLESTRTLSFWVCTPLQIIQNGSGVISVAAYENSLTGRKDSGFLNTNNSVSINNKAQHFFVGKKNVDNLVWPCFDGENLDYQGLPMSYILSVTDHGIFFNSWAESFDSKGNCFNWFVVQRLVKEDGSILLDEKSPLFCLFSKNGGGTDDSNTLDPNGIQYFVVREEDISAPASPLSAVQVSADSFPLLNPIQQVGMMVNRNIVIHFPKGVNTHRYYYPYKLDMIGYVSADLLSQKSVQPLTMFGQNRMYEAIQSNSAYNKGMRICFIKQGSGIV